MFSYEVDGEFSYEIDGEFSYGVDYDFSYEFEGEFDGEFEADSKKIWWILKHTSIYFVILGKESISRKSVECILKSQEQFEDKSYLWKFSDENLWFF